MTQQDHNQPNEAPTDDPAKSSGGGYVGGLILTGIFFLLVAALAVGGLAAVGFAALAMPITTSVVVVFFIVAGIAGWRAKRAHARAQRKAREELDGPLG